MNFQINGIDLIKLSKNSNEQTLQEKGASYFYKKVKAGVRIYDKNKNIFAFLSVSSSEPFFVSASTLDNGKIRYLFALTTQAERMLEMDNLGYLEKQKVAEKAKESFGF